MDFSSVFAYQGSGIETVSLFFFKASSEEPARLAFRFQASSGSRRSPVRQFIGERHLERRGRAGESAWLRSSGAVAFPAVVTVEDRCGALGAIL